MLYNKFLHQLISMISSISLLLQSFSPFSYIIAPTNASEPLQVKIDFDSQNNSFQIRINTQEAVNYLLAYRTDKQTEAVKGSSEKGNSDFERIIEAKTCSANGVCILQTAIRGILKTEVASSSWITEIKFSINDGKLIVDSEFTPLNLELDEEDNYWLEKGKNPTSIPLPTETIIPTAILSPTPSVIQPINPIEPVLPTIALVPTEDITPVPQQIEIVGSTSAIDTLQTAKIDGHVDTVIIASLNCRADSLNGCLVTDKPDYAPTDVAVITGAGYSPNTQYTLIITSTDSPAVNFEQVITTDLNGSFTVSYQLDGNYRPNYQVQLKDVGGAVVGATTFTDTPSSDLVPTSIGNYDSWTSNSGTKTSAVSTNNGDTTYIRNDQDGNRQSFVFSNAGIPPGSTINSVTLNVVARETESGGKIRLMAENGNGASHRDVGSSIDLTGSYQTYLRAFASNPFTGVAWTLSEVNSWSVRFGVENDANNNVRITQMFLIVDYTASSKVNTTTAIISDLPDPSIVNQSYTVNVSVSRVSGSNTPTGTVAVSDGTDSCTTSSISGSAGTATGSCNLTSSTTGVKTLTATYSGDSNFNGSSGTTLHTVNNLVTSEINYAAFEGETAPNGSGVWTTGDVKGYKEGDYINFRLNLTSTGAGTGHVFIGYTSDPACRFFNNTAPISVSATGGFSSSVNPAVGQNGNDAVADFTVSSSGVNTGILYFTLKLSDNAAACASGSSQHVQIDHTTSIVKNSGAKALPIPAKDINPVTDLLILKSAPSPKSINDSMSYTISVTNNDLVTAALNVVVTDTLPSGITYTSATWTKTPSGSGSCSHVGQVVTCNVGDLIGGSSAVITVNVTINSDVALCETTLTNAVSVTTDTLESDTTNNNATADTLINRCLFAPKLTLVKSVVNSGAGSETPDKWTLSAVGSSLSFSGKGPAVGPNEVTSGIDYTLSETGPDHYSASLWSCVGGGVLNGNKIKLSSNEEVTCTITNTYIPYCGDLNIDTGEQCDLGVDNGVSCTPQYSTSSQPNSCSYCSSQCQSVTVYGGYCGDGVQDPQEECDGTSGVPTNYSCLQSCTLVRDTGSLTLVKKINPSNDPGKFDLMVDQSIVKLSAGDNDSSGKLTYDTGSYTISETGAAGVDINDYTSTYECLDKANNNENIASGTGVSQQIRIDKGDDIVCTFTNTRNTGTIELKKSWSGLAGQTTLKIGKAYGDGDIANQLTGSDGSGPLTTGVQTVNTGTYYLIESGGLDNYNSILECLDNNSRVSPGIDGSVSVGKDHTVVCTFTNTYVPYCGDGIINQTTEECDGINLGGLDNTVFSCSNQCKVELIVPKVTICHATSSDHNPYVQNTPDKSGDLNGHNDHGGPIWFSGITVDWGDIIPPFDYYDGELQHYPGKNWTDGQSVWNNGCNQDNGTIVVYKDVQGPAGQDVIDKIHDFTIQLDDKNSQTVTDDGTVTYINVPVGAHKITESIIDSHYDLYGISFVPGTSGNTSGLSVNVAMGQVTNVYVTNRQHYGSIVVHKLVDRDANGTFEDSDPADFTWTLDEAGANVMGVTDSTINPGTHQISENPVSGYHFVGWYLTGGMDKNERLYSCDNPQSIILPIDVNIGPDESFNYTLCNAFNTGGLKVVKTVDNKSDLTQWSFSLDENKDFVNADKDGIVDFGQVIIGDHTITEKGPQGYTLVSVEGDNCLVSDGNSATAKVEYSKLTTCTFNNSYIIPELQISKSNNAIGDKSPGDTVMYTIKVKALKNKVLGVSLKDLLPKGFTFGGTWTVTKFDGTNTATMSVSNPNYHSPGTWELGDMNINDEITITFPVVISDDQMPGKYKDVSWAAGSNAISDRVLALAQTQGYVDTNFVGTNVNVVKEQQSSVSVDITKKEEGQVLGASTSTLPATGANTIWIYIMSFLVIAGFLGIITGFMFNNKKNFLHVMIFIAFALILFVLPESANAANLSIRLAQPKSPTYVTNFSLTFVVLDLNTSSLPITVKCYKKWHDSSNSDLGYSQFGSNISVTAGGNTGDCPVDSSVINKNGTYEFYATATNGLETVSSELEGIVSVDFNTSGPNTPVSYSKEQISSCQYKINFRTADDSGKTIKVEIYSAASSSFGLDSGTRVATISIGSSQNGSYTHTVSDCNKTWYFVIRAFDSYGNGSGTIGDSVVQVTTTATTTQTTTTTGSNAIPVSGVNLPGGGTVAGEVLGEITAGTQAGSILGETTPSATVEKPNKKQSLVQVFSQNKQLLALVVGILGVVLIIIAFVFNKKTKVN